MLVEDRLELEEAVNEPALHQIREASIVSGRYIARPDSVGGVSVYGLHELQCPQG